MLHITPTASAYLENMWKWTAYHDIDDPLSTQISVYVARGILIESTNPTWMYGTASEHATLYQYEFYQASNVVAGMIQTENPYYQPNPDPPAPFTDFVGTFDGDPSWAVRIIKSSNITIAGAGLYSWFQKYLETCVNTQNCELALVQIDNSYGGIYIWNFVTIGAVSVVAASTEDFYQSIALANTNAATYPWWSLITLFESNTAGEVNGNDIYVDPSI